MDFLWVGAGGALGAILRLGLSRLFSSVALPWGVFAINVLGSFLLGLVLGQNQKNGLSQTMMFFLATGLLGAFTTFSAFSWDNLQLWERGSYGMLVISVAGQLVLGIVGLWFGRSLLS